VVQRVTRALSRAIGIRSEKQEAEPPPKPDEDRQREEPPPPQARGDSREKSVGSPGTGGI